MSLVSDFYQSARLITLSDFGTNKTLSALDAIVRKPIVVIIPCYFKHYESQSVHQLLKKLCVSSLFDEVLVILNGNDDVANYHTTLLQQIDSRITVLLAPLSSTPAGKGGALWTGFHHTYKKYEDKAIIVTLDADLKSFQLELFYKLLYPLLVFDADFNKGYYARYSHHKLDGRLTRLLVFPLFHALLKQHPQSEVIQWLMQFRYPLSGDVAFQSRLIPKLRLMANWSYDLSLLVSIYQNISTEQVYQTEITSNYQHPHKTIEPNSHYGLMEVAFDIIGYLKQVNIIDSDRLAGDYEEIVIQFLHKYEKLALFNGFTFSRESEEQLANQLLELLLLNHSKQNCLSYEKNNFL